MNVNDIDALYAAIAEHLKYLDTPFADDLAEVAAELRNALALDTLTESKTQA